MVLCVDVWMGYGCVDVNVDVDVDVGCFCGVSELTN